MTDFDISGNSLLAGVSDILPLSALRDIGAGHQVGVLITCTEKPVVNGATTPYFQFIATIDNVTTMTTAPLAPLQLASTAMIGSNFHFGSGGLVNDLPEVGEQIYLPIPPFIQSKAVGYASRLYFGLVYLNPTLTIGAVIGPPLDGYYFTAGKFSAAIVVDYHNNICYPDAIS